MRQHLALVVGATALGARIGALMGSLGGCTTGACPLLANWRRGALYGGFLGLLAGLSGL